MENPKFLFAVILLVIVATTPFSHVTASTSTITISTDKPSYLIAESITVHGNLTYNGSPVQDWPVALEVQDPYTTPVVIRTLQTDTNGKYNLTFKLSTNAKLGIYTAYISSSYKGETATNNTTFEIIPIRDIAVTNAASSKTVVGQGYSVNITVIVYNQGELTETFNFTVYCNQTAITLPNGENHTTVTLASAHVTTVAIAWNTTGFALGNYTISAYAEPLLGETDILDNNCTGDIVTVTIPGDVTGEGSCDMQDISLMIDWFMTTPPNWNPNCDVNGDLSIDMADISIAIDDFMTSGAPMTKAGILYDSGWIDVSHKAGQYFDVVHNLNSTGVIVDITGKTTADGGVHQKYFGGTDFVAGWNKTYGGTDADHSAALIVTGDGGYALAGATYSYGAGNSDAWLVKTDASGNMQWNKTYGGTNDEYFRGIVQTGDGGYALAGSTTSFGAGDADAWLVKTDSSGNAQWNKTYGGTNSDGPGSLVQTIDGGYALSGQSFGVSDADAWLVKTDASGNVQWTKTYGGTSTEGALALVETGDGGYALAGITDSFGAGGYDFWLVKTDAAGNAMDGFKYGLAWVDSSANSITLYRGTDDAYWNYVRVRVWKVKESP